ncbi:MAG: cytochrome c [Gammaproteobacteria bacterium]|nr:cytochrome c [Gammaproteobacteria bacterium]
MRKNNRLLLWLLPVVLFPSLLMAASTIDGQLVYDRNCAMCHGAQGVSVMASAPSFKRGDGLFKSDTSLRDRIRTGKSACPPFIGRLKDQQIYDVISYLRTLYP